MARSVERKKLRAPGYDYSSAGRYFITIGTRDRYCILSEIVPSSVQNGNAAGENVRATVRLSDIGQNVEQVIGEMNRIYQDIRIELYVIMPNHLHLIVHVFEKAGTSRTPSPTKTNARIPALISTLKRFSNRYVEENMWQRSYYDHIIRDDSEYEAVCRYIENNPDQWEEDELFVDANPRSL